MKMQIVKYTTETEANKIIAEKEALGLTLIEVSNITEGNFLGFAESASELPKEKETIEDKLQRIEENIAAILKTLEATEKLA
jgi:hypothetical protein